jgi:luciferase family oxidoreductase group 1
LDLAPIVEGGSAGVALEQAAELAQAVERLGYHRYWMAEHHSMAGVASAATAVALAFIGARTTTIRIGSGGIMLPNHAPLVIAEQFGTLESLYPGRVDLGLGRAPGTDQAAAHALRRSMTSDPQQFPNDVLELVSYFRGDSGKVQAIPGTGLNIPIFILGSSLFGAQLAAMLGLPFAFASHFAPQLMMEAVELYRHRFEPSESLDQPYLLLGLNAFVADTDEEARLLATSVQQAFVALRSGQPIQLPPPRGDFLQSLPFQARAVLHNLLSCSAIGSPDTARAQVKALVDQTGANELVVTSQIFDLQARIRSFELLAEAVGVSHL